MKTFGSIDRKMPALGESCLHTLMRYLGYQIELLKAKGGIHLSEHERVPTLRLLFLSDGVSYLNERQISPFYCFREALRRELGVVFHHVILNPTSLPSQRDLRGFDIIVPKLHYKMPPEDVSRIAIGIRKAASPRSRIIYFDGRDDLCIQFPELLVNSDLYVKRHVFRDRSMYLKRYVGSINLTDYVYRQHGSFALNGDEGMSEPIGVEDLPRIHCGMSFGMDDVMISLMERFQDVSLDVRREIDVICRANVPDNWMGYLRRPVMKVLDQLESSGLSVITPEKRVTQEQYYREMLGSKICVSPLGYGEVCYRDYEAVIFGCLLIKPVMSHAEVYPDIFRPYETYVPVAWDYSDLEEKINYYLQHEEERLNIANRAHAILKGCHQAGNFIRNVASMMDKTQYEYEATAT